MSVSKLDPSPDYLENSWPLDPDSRAGRHVHRLADRWPLDGAWLLLIEIAVFVGLAWLANATDNVLLGSMLVVLAIALFIPALAVADAADQHVCSHCRYAQSERHNHCASCGVALEDLS